MDKVTREHLERIDAEGLLSKRENCITEYAISFSRKRRRSLGIDGYGKFVVNDNGEIEKYTDAELAIEAYKSKFEND